MTTRHAPDGMLRVAAWVGAMLAAGCGGGGGDSSPPPELLQITSQNQVAVARATVVNFSSLSGLSDVTYGLSASPEQATALDGITKHALGTAVATARAAEAKVRPLSMHSETEPCPMGGTTTVTFDDRDNNQAPSPGDLLTVAFDQCRVDDDSSANGSFSVAFSSVGETPTSFHMSGRFSFSQLTMVEGRYASSVHGAANCNYVETYDSADGTTVRLDMSVVDSLVGSGSMPGYSDTFTHDPGFTGVWIDVMPAWPGEPYSTAAMNGKVHVASLGGRILLETPIPVHDWWEQSYPDSGQVLVHGYRSHLRMSVLNTALVRLELDANDDASWEGLREMPWNELLP